MKDLGTLKFVSVTETLVRADGIIEVLSAYYDPALDTVGLMDDNIHTAVHELCERDVIDIIGYIVPIQSTIVSHIMSPYKGAQRGRWRTWGTKP